MNLEKVKKINFLYTYYGFYDNQFSKICRTRICLVIEFVYFHCEPLMKSRVNVIQRNPS